jgi:hypothetical protein
MKKTTPKTYMVWAFEEDIMMAFEAVSESQKGADFNVFFSKKEAEECRLEGEEENLVQLTITYDATEEVT